MVETGHLGVPFESVSQGGKLELRAGYHKSWKKCFQNSLPEISEGGKQHRIDRNGWRARLDLHRFTPSSRRRRHHRRPLCPRRRPPLHLLPVLRQILVAIGQRELSNEETRLRRSLVDILGSSSNRTPTLDSRLSQPLVESRITGGFHSPIAPLNGHAGRSGGRRIRNQDSNRKVDPIPPIARRATQGRAAREKPSGTKANIEWALPNARASAPSNAAK
jgi:hypothetical protein